MDTGKMISQLIDLFNTGYKSLGQTEEQTKHILKRISDLGIISMDKTDHTMEDFLRIREICDEMYNYLNETKHLREMCVEMSIHLNETQRLMEMPVVYASPFKLLDF